MKIFNYLYEFFEDGNFSSLTSLINFFTAFKICFSILTYFFTNLGFFFVELKFSISSITKTWPSQYFDDPMPIVGIDNALVIFFEAAAVIHSRTINFDPAFSSFLARLTNTSISDLFFPTLFILLKSLNFWGVTPMCETTFIFF